MWLVVLLILVIILYWYFEPYIDWTSDGSVILWYNKISDRPKRTFTYLYKKKQ